jgi:CRP-like cAMP-binding protein
MTSRRSAADSKAPGLPPRFLSGLTHEQTKAVLKAAEKQFVPAHRVVVNGGDKATHLFQLTKGRLKYYRLTSKGDEILLWLVTPGDTFGLGSLLVPSIRYFGTAETLEDCELLVWSARRIRQFAGTHKVLADNALRIVMHYLGEYHDRLAGLVSKTARERIAQVVIRLARQAERVQSGAVEFAITNEHLGGLADVTPFTASRQLKEWEREGIVKKTRGKIRILAPENLLIE